MSPPQSGRIPRPAREATAGSTRFRKSPPKFQTRRNRRDAAASGLPSATLHSRAVFLAESIVHSVNPYLVDFGGGFGIRWYGLSYAVGFLIAWLILRFLVKQSRTPLSAPQISDLLTYLVFGVIIGGRLGDVLFYHQSLLWKFSASFPFWGVLEIHKGGMSSHGGIVGVIVACVLFARKCRVPFFHVTDLASLAAPPGLALGRLANWVNGELPGKALPESMQADPPWWSVKYPEEILAPGFTRGAELAELPAARLAASKAPRNVVLFMSLLLLFAAVPGRTLLMLRIGASSA